MIFISVVSFRADKSLFQGKLNMIHSSFILRKSSALVAPPVVWTWNRRSHNARGKAPHSNCHGRTVSFGESFGREMAEKVDKRWRREGGATRKKNESRRLSWSKLQEGDLRIHSRLPFWPFMSNYTSKNYPKCFKTLDKAIFGILLEPHKTPATWSLPNSSLRVFWLSNEKASTPAALGSTFKKGHQPKTKLAPNLSLLSLESFL